MSKLIWLPWNQRFPYTGCRGCGHYLWRLPKLSAWIFTSTTSATLILVAKVVEFQSATTATIVLVVRVVNLNLHNDNLGNPNCGCEGCGHNIYHYLINLKTQKPKVPLYWLPRLWTLCIQVARVVNLKFNIDNLGNPYTGCQGFQLEFLHLQPRQPLDWLPRL